MTTPFKSIARFLWWILIMALLLGTQMLCEQGRANDERPDYLVELLHARSAAEVEALKKREERRTQSSLVCELQLKNRRLPGACFEAIRLTRSKASSSLATSLESICRDRANESIDLGELERFVLMPHIPSDCLEIARRRLADLIYLQEARAPEELLRRTELKP